MSLAPDPRQAAVTGRSGGAGRTAVAGPAPQLGDAPETERLIRTPLANTLPI